MSMLAEGASVLAQDVDRAVDCLDSMVQAGRAVRAVRAVDFLDSKVQAGRAVRAVDFLDSKGSDLRH